MTAACSANREGGTPTSRVNAVLNALAEDATRTATLGFTPLDTTNCTAEARHEENTTLFVTGELIPLLSENKVMFPLLTHA